MLIHDTKELRLRARSHAKYDHIKQGTYGDARTNGKTEFQGCAVGCLSTPHRKKEMRDHIIEHGTPREEDGEQFFEASFYGNEQREWIEEEFGICNTMMLAGEAFFEAQPTHGAAIEFVKNFALSFNEGADFTEEMVQEWCAEQFGYGIYEWEAIQNWIYEKQCSAEYDREEPVVYEDEIKRLTILFLDWIKSIKPAAVTV